MKTRRLSQGMVEAYNNRLRIRLKPLPNADYALVIIYSLKQNKFYRSRTILKVERGLTIDQVIELCEAMQAEIA